ncbi:hypothetical protein EMIHUDRAFT_244254 [Emiliania huxleyi CCMP1516]|uniref:Phospholipase/carboxylesterase/thioesterase domain-containing protein n=2 Tax=Emiliania huxleyi TaxID=2903 RepID=A0A0D3J155_EMIH1|nr:hypothetical protein EMIHUDRAFT_244254 [Emiliania huxleyi CCMP1516]EOD17240.1 hypothetical protein EMIHUDRAFT_244254 [Emiliania huxleyi CCMP1516]|eukprot:XP_005769669.1 hypothetical protein EMIHUDRAFT_244254 [Emiliania huxleyi CCMP1516]
MAARSTSSLLELRENPSRWVWAAAAARVPPTAAALSRCGFRRGVWADGLPRDAPNLLLLLHGLGDAPDMYARFGAKLALPQTSALALAAPLPLPLGIEGGAWAPLLSVLRLLVRECGWSPERIFLFGYAHGGTVALDLLQHLDGLAGGGPCRLGGCVSWFCPGEAEAWSGPRTRWALVTAILTALS